MALQLMPGQLEKFIGTFYRVNAKRPPARPDFNANAALDRLVIAKGMLQLTLGGDKVEVHIPPQDQVDNESYQGFVNLLAQELVNLLQVPQHTPQVAEAMRNAGLVAQFFGPSLTMNPLSASVGELDQF